MSGTHFVGCIFYRPRKVHDHSTRNRKLSVGDDHLNLDRVVRGVIFVLFDKGTRGSLPLAGASFCCARSLPCDNLGSIELEALCTRNLGTFEAYGMYAE